MSGGKCPENPYQGFYQKTGQCWLDAVSMALIFGGDTSDTIITQITDHSIDPNFLENIFKQKRTVPYNIVTIKNRDLFRKHVKIYIENIGKRLIQTLQNTEESHTPLLQVIEPEEGVKPFMQTTAHPPPLTAPEQNAMSPLAMGGEPKQSQSTQG